MAWADYLHTGNARSISRYYDELKPKTLLALAGTNVLVSTRTGLQSKEFLKSIHFNGKELRDIVDWPTAEADGYNFQEFNTVVNAFHYRSLVLMEKMAMVMDKTDDSWALSRSNPVSAGFSSNPVRAISSMPKLCCRRFVGQLQWNSSADLSLTTLI